MNIRDLIAAHSRYRSRLGNLLAGHRDDALNAERIALDTECELGVWLLGDGQIHADRPQYRELLEVHRWFHRAAAVIIEDYHAGRPVDPAILGLGSEFANLSLQITKLLTELHALATRP